LHKQVKYLVIGQGIVGTWMSYQLEQAGISYLLINDESIQSASSVASGVINPVTGRRIVQTWMIETLLPFAINAYTALQEKLNIKIIQEAPVILLHPSEQMKDSFNYRLTHENIYLIQQDPSKWTPYFNAPYGAGGVDECYWLDINNMLQSWKAFVKSNGNYINAHFNIEDLHLHENKIEWKNITAEKIIFCDGISSMQNPYFKSLPFAPNKGEALIVKIPGLPNKNIYKNNISIIPWKDDLFWVGSNYEWTYTNQLPSNAFKEKMIQQLDSFLKLPYEIVDHIVGIRPTNTQRRPFVGVHPTHAQLAICNGMGTKGCSLAPYFTAQLLDHLEKGTAIETEANLERFAQILKENT
jgi:glycine/D-amino acid oxidase-like deaminating enzyme